jgi:uncharacterized membrane protein YozB (DUF420 family)
LVVFQHAEAGGHLRISPAVDLAFGLILLILAIRILLRPASERQQHARPASTGPIACTLLGVGLMLTNFSSLALFVPAVKEIAVATSVGIAYQVLVLVLALLIALSAVLVPLLLYALAPTRAQAVLTPILEKTKRHNRAMSIAVCLIFGIYLSVKGIARI